MDKIYIISATCADFFSPGGTVFRVLRGEIGKVIEAPAWVQETSTFKILEKSGRIYVTTKPEEAEEPAPVEEPVQEEAPVEEPAVLEPVEIESVIEPVVKKRKKKSDAE